MGWFSVKVLFESVHSDAESMDDREKLFEESIIVLQANSADQAQERAKQHADQMQHGYRVLSGDWVEWQFVRVLDVFELIEDRVTDGVEVYARFIVAQPEDSADDVVERYFPESRDT